MLSFVLLRQIEIGHIHVVCISSDCFHFKSCQLKRKCAEEPKKLCECLTTGSVFSGMVEQVKNKKSKALYTVCHEWFEWFECELDDLIRVNVDYV